MKNENIIKEYLKQELGCHHVQVYLQEHEGMLPDYVPEKLSELCGEEVVEVECTLLDGSVYLLGIAYIDYCEYINVGSLVMVPNDLKISYPFTHDGLEVLKYCEGKIMVFSYLDKQIVGEFWLEGDCPLSLRLGDQKMLTGLDIYPELGLVTFAGSFTITSNL